MIYLQKGQPLHDNQGLVVCDPTGYYEDGEGVVCASVVTPDEPAVKYEAQFIAYGGIVYSISDQDALLEEVKKMDPASLFGKTSQDVAVDNAVNSIVPTQGGQATASPDDVTITPIDDTSTTDPSAGLPTIGDDDTATTTLPVISSDTSTTTLPSVDVDSASSTLPVVDFGDITSSSSTLPDIGTTTGQ